MIARRAPAPDAILPTLAARRPRPRGGGRGARAARRRTAAARRRRPAVRGHARQPAGAGRAGRRRRRGRPGAAARGRDERRAHLRAPDRRRCPSPARRLLALAAAEDSGELAVLERAAAALGLDFARAGRRRARAARRGRGRAARVLPPARALGGVPLGAAGRAPRGARGARRGARRGSTDRRAWHLAAAALGPDDGGRAASSSAAGGPRSRPQRLRGRRQRRSSAPRGSRPRRPDRARRLFAAAEAAWLAGHTERASERLADGARRVRGPGAAARDRPPARPRGAALRAGSMDAHDILVAAAEEAAAARRPARACCSPRPADAVLLRRAPAGDAAHRARRAWAALPAAGRRARALLRDARARDGADLHGRGRGGRRAPARGRRGPRALRRALGRSAAALLGGARPAVAARGRARAARSWRARSSRRAATGALGALPFALWLAARDAATRDRLAVADALYEEAIRLARETGQATSLCAGLAGLACVEAQQGARGRPAASTPREALALTGELGLGLLPAVGARRARRARARPRPDRARRSRGWRRRSGCSPSAASPTPTSSPVPELVEALVRLDRVDAAPAARRLRGRRRGQGPAVGARAARALPRPARRLRSSATVRGGARACTR